MMVATAGGVLYAGIADLQYIEWLLVASAGVLAAAGVGLSRKSIYAQVASRAAGWVVFAPMAMVAVVSTLAARSPELGALGLAATSGAALLLARPMLHTAEARAEFAPARFRKWLLAGATSSTATAAITGVLGFDALHRALNWGHGHAIAAGFFALTASLLMSAFGVLRMRTWGILLGGLTSFGTLLASAILGGPAGLALSLVAMPCLLFFVLPIVMARRERNAAPVRVASFEDAMAMRAEELPSRIRVVDDEFEIDDRDELALHHESAEGPRRAATIA